MADDKLSRFKILEKGRREPASGESSSVAQKGRFGALGAAPAPAPTTGQSGVAQRFAPPGGLPARSLEDLQKVNEQPSGLELAQANPQDQPFVRCAACQADNNAWTSTCQQCGNSLDTDQQRAFNEKLWAQLKAEKQQQESAAQEMVQQQAPYERGGAPNSLTPMQQRMLGEQIAQQAADQVRERMDMDSFRSPMSSSGGTWGTGFGYGVGPARFSLLGWLFGKLNPQVRWALVLGLLLVPAVLTFFQRTRALGFLGFFVVGALLLHAWISS